MSDSNKNLVMGPDESQKPRQTGGMSTGPNIISLSASIESAESYSCEKCESGS